MDFFSLFFSPSAPQISNNLSVFLSVPIGLATGLVSGLYGGVVVARYWTFDSLRKEALRVVRGIDFMDEGRAVTFRNHEEFSQQMVLISADFFGDGHQKAGKAVSDVAAILRELIYKGERGGVDYATFNIEYGNVQGAIRKVGPSWPRLLSLLPRKRSQ